MHTCTHTRTHTHTHTYTHTHGCTLLLPQFASHFLLLLGMNLIGIYYNYLADLAQRKTFSGTRRYIRSLVSIEEQKRKKVSFMV